MADGNKSRIWLMLIEVVRVALAAIAGYFGGGAA